MQKGRIPAEESFAPFSPFYCTAVSRGMLKNAILVVTELVFSNPMCLRVLLLLISNHRGRWRPLGFAWLPCVFG